MRLLLSIVLSLSFFCSYGQSPFAIGKTLTRQVDTILVPTSTSAGNGSRGPRQGGPRRIFFLHGFEGKLGAWQRPVTKVSAKYSNIYPSTVRYSKSKASLLTAATKVRQEINILTNGDTDEELKGNFIIAHSLGGLVSRELDRLYDTDNDYHRAVHGLVTFGAPHGGMHFADVMNNEPERLTHFYDQVCRELTAGPLADGEGDMFTEFFSFLSAYVPKRIRNDCDAIPRLRFIEQRPHMDISLARDLGIASPRLQALENYPRRATIPHVVTAVGIESPGNPNEVLPRFFGSFLKDPLTFEYGQAGLSDQIGLDTFSNKALRVDARVQQLEADLDLDAVDVLFATGGLVGALSNEKFNHRPLREKLRDYQQTQSFYRNINNRWLRLIGSIQQPITEQWLCREDLGNGDFYEYDVDSEADCDCSTCYAYRAEIPGDIQFRESDGFVLAESATDLQYKSSELDIEMLGSGHFQMRNDDNLSRELRILFESDRYDEFFRLDE